MTTRKKYPKEFKLDAISLVLDQEYTRAEAARSLEINANLIARWIKEYSYSKIICHISYVRKISHQHDNDTVSLSL